MSYILEALKRSEQERHQGELNPTTIDTIMMPSKQVHHQWWPYLLIAILILNLLVYVYFQFASDDVKVSKSAMTRQVAVVANEQLAVHQSIRSQQSFNVSENQVSSDIAQAVLINEKPLPSHLLQTPNLSKRFDLSDSARTQRPAPVNQTKNNNFTEEGFEIIQPKPSTTAISSEGLMPPQVTEAKANDGLTKYQKLHKEMHQPKVVEHHLKPLQKVPVEAEPVKLESFEHIQHLNDLDSSFQRGIPDISFNSHIYSLEPSDRRVMINDLYLREGQSFSGIRIETIGEFYLVLSKDSQEFKLPVLRDWFKP